MNLQDLCEPIFQYVCMLNRIARNPGGENVQFQPLRETIQSIFGSMAEAAKDDPHLSEQYKKMEMPLVFFVDSVIAESKLGVAKEWHKNRMAYERDELAGDEKFFDLLDETLAEQGKAADERLAIYYTCMGLGFAGWYAGQPEYLRKKMLTIAPRITDVMEADQNARLCPEAYSYLDRRNLVETPGVKLMTMLIAFVGLCLVVLVVNFYLFRTASKGLTDALAEILRHDLWSAH